MSMHLTHRLVPGLLAGSMILGGGSSVFAATGKAHVQRAFAYGQVSNLSSTGFTLTWTPKKAGATTSPKVVQVGLSSTTKEKARKGTSGTLASGEYALVIGTKSASGVTAQRVVYATVAFNGRRMIKRLKAQAILHRLSRHHVAGTVNAATTTATSLSITTAKGKTLTFTITAQTTYRVNKVRATTAPALVGGEKVRVFFATAGKGAAKTRTAQVIVVVPGAAA